MYKTSLVKATKLVLTFEIVDFHGILKSFFTVVFSDYIGYKFKLIQIDAEQVLTGVSLSVYTSLNTSIDLKIFTFHQNLEEDGDVGTPVLYTTATVEPQLHSYWHRINLTAPNKLNLVHNSLYENRTHLVIGIEPTTHQEIKLQWQSKVYYIVYCFLKVNILKPHFVRTLGKTFVNNCK